MSSSLFGSTANVEAHKLFDRLKPLLHIVILTLFSPNAHALVFSCHLAGRIGPASCCSTAIRIWPIFSPPSFVSYIENDFVQFRSNFSLHLTSGICNSFLASILLKAAGFSLPQICDFKFVTFYFWIHFIVRSTSAAQLLFLEYCNLFPTLWILCRGLVQLSRSQCVSGSAPLVSKSWWNEQREWLITS